MTTTLADLRADVAAALDELATVTTDDVHGEPDVYRPGWTRWSAGRMWVHLPSLRPTASPDAVARYWLRIHAGLTGECVMCGAVADLSATPGTVAFAVDDVTVIVAHRPGCPARFDHLDAELFDPRALAPHLEERNSS